MIVMKRRTFIQSLFAFGGAVYIGLDSVQLSKSFPFVRRCRVPRWASAVVSAASNESVTSITLPQIALPPSGGVLIAMLALRQDENKWSKVHSVNTFNKLRWTRCESRPAKGVSVETWYAAIPPRPWYLRILQGRGEEMVVFNLNAPTVCAVTLSAFENVDEVLTSPPPFHAYAIQAPASATVLF